MDRYAILIANDTFSFSDGLLEHLKTVVGDSEGMESLLKSLRTPPFKISTCFNRKPQEIQSCMSQSLATAKSDDLILIYYAGHGRVGYQHDGKCSLLLATSESRPVPEAPYFDYGFWQIEEYLQRRDFKRVVVILDCCYSGAAIHDLEFRGGSTAPLDSLPFPHPNYAPIVPTVPDNIPISPNVDGKGFYILTACAADERAAGNVSAGHGAFTGTLIDVVKSLDSQSPHPITIQKVYAEVTARMKGLPQTPKLFRVSGDDEPFPIAGQKTLGEDESKALFDYTPLASTWLSRVDSPIPTYLLDWGFRFIHWNPAFEDLVARQLGLVIGCHAMEFVNKLENVAQVDTRNKQHFPTPDDERIAALASSETILQHYPVVDREPLEFMSDRFGLIIFDKYAQQIREEDSGAPKYWQVQLCPRFVQRENNYWVHAKRIAEIKNCWTAYASFYDQVITRYPGHSDLVQRVLGFLGNNDRCIEVGAGTGNLSHALLRESNRTVSAIECNDAMLVKLATKLAEFGDRKSVLKGDAISVMRRMHTCISPCAAATPPFDACILMNVLLTSTDFDACLRAAFELLRPEGSLVLSVPLSNANTRLLSESVAHWFENNFPMDWVSSGKRAWEFSQELEAYLKTLLVGEQFTPESIRQLILGSQFRIVEDSISQAMDGTILVVKAIKPDFKAKIDIRTHDEPLRPEVEPEKPSAKVKSPEAKPLGEGEGDADAVSPTNELRAPDKRKVSMFISYARNDLELANTFLEQMRKKLGASAKYQFDYLKDDEIVRVGDDWHGKIQEALMGCDVSLLLVSPSFLISDYIRNEEVRRLLHTNPKPIIPVLLEEIDFEIDDLGSLKQLQFFVPPRKRKPCSFANCTRSARSSFVLQLHKQIERRLDALSIAEYV